MKRFVPALVRALLGLVMVFMGALHFADPAHFVRMMPAVLPHPEFLVRVSGAAAIVGGLGLFVPWPTERRVVTLGLLAFYVIVFPANVNVAVNHIQLVPGRHVSDALLWARLPLQLVFLGVAWWLYRADERMLARAT
jgi:uncharacterized membrane protein